MSLWACGGQASGFQIGAGSITTHYGVGPGWKNYCNQIGHSDVINNPVFFIRAEGEKHAFTAMAGEDSICSPIEGAFYSYKFHDGKWFGFSFIIGGYHMDYNNWTWEEAHTPSNQSPVYPVYIQFSSTYYLVPVLGFELDIALYHWDTWSLEFETVIAPIIIPTFLALKKKF